MFGVVIIEITVCFSFYLYINLSLSLYLLHSTELKTYYLPCYTTHLITYLSNTSIYLLIFMKLHAQCEDDIYVPKPNAFQDPVPCDQQHSSLLQNK